MGDVYNLTIVANLNGQMSPIQFNQCLRQCFFCFNVQILACFFFYWDYRFFDQFQPIETNATSLRVICTMLLHKCTHAKLNKSLLMLTYLKRVKGAHAKTKYMNIILIFMQIIIPIYCIYTI
jgi:hypothetical protein